MGSSPPSPPPAPSPQATAAAQTGQNVLSSVANQYGGLVNVNSPFGNIDYTNTANMQLTDPNSGTVYSIPSYTQNVNLSAPGQSLLQNTLGTQSLAGQQAQQLLTNANYGQVPDPVGTATTGMTADLINQNLNYLQPLQIQSQQRADTTLRNQGVLPGTPAYTSAMRDLMNQQGSDINQMIIGSQGTAFNEAQSNYLRPLQVAQGLYPLGSPTQPSMVQTPAGNYNQQPTNYAGIVNSAYQNQLSGYNAQVQANSANNAALGGIISPFAKIFAGGFGA